MIDIVDDDLIAGIKADHSRLMNLLIDKEPSLAISMESTLSKTLLVSGASHIEVVVQEMVAEYFNVATGGNTTAVEFVRNKAISRQFHTYFQWDCRNANQFFGLFGPAFKERAVKAVKADPNLSAAVSDFMELGSLRNQLVHGNFALFPLTKTADEISKLYDGAVMFLKALAPLLEEASRIPDSTEGASE